MKPAPEYVYVNYYPHRREQYGAEGTLGGAYIDTEAALEMSSAEHDNQPKRVVKYRRVD